MRRDVDRQREATDLLLELDRAVHESSVLLNSIEDSLDLHPAVRLRDPGACGNHHSLRVDAGCLGRGAGRVEAARPVDAKNAPTGLCKTADGFAQLPHASFFSARFQRNDEDQNSAESLIIDPQILRRRRKNISVEQGDQRLFDEIRYFFYLTNDHETAAADVVFLANDRCNQENLIDQLKHGVGATRMPVDTLLSNWAYMVLAALAWTRKAWFALRLPATGRWAARYAAEKAAVLRMEFKTCLHAFMLIPVQVVRTSRRLVFRLLAWNPWQAIFLRGFDHWREPLRC